MLLYFKPDSIIELQERRAAMEALPQRMEELASLIGEDDPDALFSRAERTSFTEGLMEGLGYEPAGT